MTLFFEITDIKLLLKKKKETQEQNNTLKHMRQGYFLFVKNIARFVHVIALTGTCYQIDAGIP